MSSANDLVLVSSGTMETLDTVKAEGLDVFLPEYTLGWSLVLDCRIAPYNTQELESLCAFAKGVRKDFLLLNEIPQGTLSSAKAEFTLKI